MRLATKYFEHPDVSVAIKQSTAHVVTVDGAVNQAGQFQMAGPLTLIQTVSLARGTSQDANPRRVAVFRTVDGKRQAAAFDLTAIRRGESPDPRIIPATSSWSTVQRSRNCKGRSFRPCRCWESSVRCSDAAAANQSARRGRVNTSLPVPNDGSWPVQAYGGSEQLVRGRAQLFGVEHPRPLGAYAHRRTTGAGWSSARWRSDLRALSSRPC